MAKRWRKHPLPHWRRLLADTPAGTGIALKFVRTARKRPRS
jgi:hypothetical protein